MNIFTQKANITLWKNDLFIFPIEADFSELLPCKQTHQPVTMVAGNTRHICLSQQQQQQQQQRLIVETVILESNIRQSVTISRALQMYVTLCSYLLNKVTLAGVC